MKIVVFGGGTGLSVLLRGLKKYTKDITAIVTVADDGGGSGVLREDLGMLPPGDIRNCIAALSDIEPVMIKLLQHRFKEGYLKGQSFGNLLIAAMYEQFGDFEHALKEVSSIFRLSGKVLPMTLEDTHLKAELKNGKSILGEKNIPEYVKKINTEINRISLVPESCNPLEETVNEISKADIIILGPGSLFTSVIPNLLINDIAGKIGRSKAKVFYICNIMTQPGETDRFDVVDHLKAIQVHIGNKNIIDYVVVNDEKVPKNILEKYKHESAEQVIFKKSSYEIIQSMNIGIISDNFLDIEKNYIRHDAEKVGKIIIETVL